MENKNLIDYKYYEKMFYEVERSPVTRIEIAPKLFFYYTPMHPGYHVENLITKKITYIGNHASKNNIEKLHNLVTEWQKT